MQHLSTPHVLVTGAAGFIGLHVCQRLLETGYRVTGLDVVSERFAQLRRDRLAVLGIDLPERKNARQRSTRYAELDFYRSDIRDRESMAKVFASGITHVIHLAALVGVRRSVEAPRPYQEVNVEGFFNVLELSRQYNIAHLVFASSSSVYGLTDEIPFRVEHPVDHPASFYAATKKANELFAHSYAHLHGLPVTGLRFFTVYGPWGRPDMAPYLFTRNIVDGVPIRVFNYGKLRRDFTYVGDIAEGIARIWSVPPVPLAPDAPLVPGRSRSPYRVYNIGHGAPVDIMAFIQEIEALTGHSAEIQLVEHQPGDVEETFADIAGLRADFGYAPATGLEVGLRAYWEWFREYYAV
ncbi:MAG: NAD-dependent epimerase/dehydratase family protein [Bacteroidota bacterium]